MGRPGLHKGNNKTTNKWENRFTMGNNSDSFLLRLQVVKEGDTIREGRIDINRD